MDHPDVALILLHVANATRNYLEERESIPIFAYEMKTPEQLTRVVIDEVIRGDSRDKLQRFRSYLRQEAADKGLRAVAIITDSQWDQGANGSDSTHIRVDIDHRDIEPLVWHLQYRRCESGYRFGDKGEKGVLTPGRRFAFDP